MKNKSFISRDSITDIWGLRTAHTGSQWPVRDQHLEEEPVRWVQACRFLCSNGCGIDIGVKDDQPGGRMVGVRGREADVVNHGRLGPKCDLLEQWKRLKMRISFILSMAR